MPGPHATRLNTTQQPTPYITGRPRLPPSPAAPADLKALHRRLSADLDGWQVRARGLLDARGAALDGLAQRLGADLDGREAELRVQEAQLQVCPGAAAYSSRTHAASQRPCRTKPRGNLQHVTINTRNYNVLRRGTDYAAGFPTDPSNLWQGKLTVLGAQLQDELEAARRAAAAEWEARAVQVGRGWGATFLSPSWCLRL